MEKLTSGQLAGYGFALIVVGGFIKGIIGDIIAVVGIGMTIGGIISKFREK